MKIFFTIAVWALILASTTYATDTDNDRISDLEEEQIGTNKYKSDSDADGTNDYHEICYKLDPLNPREKLIKTSFDLKDCSYTVTFLQDEKVNEKKVYGQGEYALFHAHKKYYIDKRRQKYLLPEEIAKIEQRKKEITQQQINKMLQNSRIDIKDYHLIDNTKELEKLDAIMNQIKLDNLEMKIDDLQRSLDKIDQ